MKQRQQNIIRQFTTRHKGMTLKDAMDKRWGIIDNPKPTKDKNSKKSLPTK